VTRRILATTIVMLVLIDLTLLGDGPLSGRWASELTFRPNGTLTEGQGGCSDLDS